MNDTVQKINGADPVALARAAITAEENEKAVKALKDLYRQESSAAKVLANIRRQIADAERAIRDGSFVG